jgi:colanic acid/amylovoran biosynthesis glycosyltransferase
MTSFSFSPPKWRSGEQLNLLGVGRLVEKKGFRYAIEAVARLTSEGLKPHLTLAGAGPLQDDLKTQASLLGVESRVHFAGAVTHSEVARLLAQTHIFLAPSLTARDGDSDASINTLKEAMSAGVPFVASDHGGIPELVGGVDAGVLATEGDASAITAGVEALLARHDEWPQMADRGRARIESRYSIKSITTQLTGVYQAIINGQSLDGSTQEKMR